MFQLETPLLELMARGAFLFILFMGLFRLLPRRTGGELAPMDLVFLLLVTEAAAHSLGDYTSLADGTVMILTLIALNYLTNRLSFHFPWFERVAEHSPLQIIKDGKTIPRNLRKELITPEELMGHLRLNGVGDISQVISAHVEGDGRLSVVTKGGEGGGEAEDGGSRA
ncbi:DUF421 domain-containing protein [Paracoccus sp. (in: a-proteobacteria)]|uniref:DUF421 domain-containing protein n=1 Tax=Paracoccus sp. TaxID=267 RepID=UPI0026E03DFD|nr:YetF domain-containing protein [Paracoccus sp. (in: a-proteobacteria)]MDO5369505.1 DUF421 domain-containing protein [Paracoccus sp. (in: a-proteobacteria)]